MKTGTSNATRRAAGILLHPTSLPSAHGVGDVGSGAFAFMDWLRAGGMTLWQLLPLVPPGHGGAPYSSPSSFAGNPLLIDLEDLVGRGLLSRSDVDAGASHGFDSDFVEWARVIPWKQALVDRAARRFADSSDGKHAIASFVARQPWAQDDALFAALKHKHGGRAWWHWDPPLARRDAVALATARAELRDLIEQRLAEQTLFDLQWQRLRAGARERGISLIGDIPIYVDRDSVDVWANTAYFQLNDDLTPRAVSGVPPDAFSDLGQLWGNPLYDWDTLRRDEYRWWIARLRRNFELCDIVRIDHFRAFDAYWEVGFGAPDAREGRWVAGPGIGFFHAVKQSFGELPIIAEDLGIITDDVTALRDATGLPGMKVLQFAFGDGPDNHYLPHNHVEQCVVYTGTHDNDTTLGWWRRSSDRVQDHVRRYLARDGSDVVWDLIRCALSSPARMSIVPMQDVLTLDSGARMNVPGQADGNWAWRVRGDAFHKSIAGRLREMNLLYQRVA